MLWLETIAVHEIIRHAIMALVRRIGSAAPQMAAEEPKLTPEQVAELESAATKDSEVVTESTAALALPDYYGTGIIPLLGKLT